MSSNQSEDELLQRLQLADENAYAQLFKRYADSVFNLSLGIIQHNEEAEDIVQEVFISVFRNIGAFEGRSSLKTWIYQITLNKTQEHLRHKQRKKRFAFVQSLWNAADGNLQTDQPDFMHPGVVLENKERTAVLFKALNRLPENQKNAFILHKLEGQSYQEICEIMELSLSSVESLLFRAKQNLRKLLNDYYQKNEK